MTNHSVLSCRWTVLLGMLVLLSPLASCQRAPLAEAPNETAADGPSANGSAASEPLPASNPQRIVALTSLSADLVHQLDRDRLVGIPGSPILTDQAEFQTITVVSQGQTPPQLEKIVALEPDLVIGARGFHDQVLAQLSQSGIPVMATEINRWSDLADLTETLAALTESPAAPVVARYEQCFDQAPAQGASVLVLVSREPLLSPNADSWAGDLLTRFNAQNVTAQLQGQSPIEGYVTLSAEKVLEVNPDILVLVETNNDLVAQLQAEPFWQDLKAVQSGQVHELDYYGLINPAVSAASRPPVKS